MNRLLVCSSTTISHGIADEFFHGIAHRARAEFRMKTATDKEWENRSIGCEFMAFGFQERQFLIQQQAGRSPTGGRRSAG